MMDGDHRAFAEACGANEPLADLQGGVWVMGARSVEGEGEGMRSSYVVMGAEIVQRFNGGSAMEI